MKRKMKKKAPPKFLRSEPNPGVAEAIKKAGGQTELAALMEVTQPAVNHWLFSVCPPIRAKEIEAKLGIPRETICPEVFA